MKLGGIKSGLCVVLAALLTPALVIAAHSDLLGCDGCHTPHNADILPGVPLWSGNETTLTFTPYSSATLDAVVGQPDGASKLCLSCHDGANPDYSWMDPEMVFTAGELVNSHPISFVYDSGLAALDPGLKDPSQPSTLGGTIAEDLLDPDSKVQCSSCHDVHTSGIGNHQLRGKDYFSGPGGGELCRMCHIK
ncbi:MAG: cytochrome C [Sedimentisphaerales bacterium]